MDKTDRDAASCIGKPAVAAAGVYRLDRPLFGPDARLGLPAGTGVAGAWEAIEPLLKDPFGL